MIKKRREVDSRLFVPLNEKLSVAPFANLMKNYWQKNNKCVQKKMRVKRRKADALDKWERILPEKEKILHISSAFIFVNPLTMAKLAAELYRYMDSSAVECM